jgi:hypothetical protein
VGRDAPPCQVQLGGLECQIEDVEGNGEPFGVDRRRAIRATGVAAGLGAAGPSPGGRRSGSG